jgi:hypothetical protein
MDALLDGPGDEGATRSRVARSCRREREDPEAARRRF